MRLGWGISLADAATRLVDLATDETPLDPRLQKKALDLVRGIPEARRDERARIVYKDILEHIQEGEESDGRKVLFGKSGSRQAAFSAPDPAARHPDRGGPREKPPRDAAAFGKLSEVEALRRMVVQRIDTDKGVTLAHGARQVRPVRLRPRRRCAGSRADPPLSKGTPRDTVPERRHRRRRLVRRARGPARGRLGDDRPRPELQRQGRHPDAQRVRPKWPRGSSATTSSSRASSGRNLPGARVRELEVREPRETLEAPLVLRARVEVPELAHVRGDALSIESLFPLHLRAPRRRSPRAQTPLTLADLVPRRNEADDRRAGAG